MVYPVPCFLKQLCFSHKSTQYHNDGKLSLCLSSYLHCVCVCVCMCVGNRDIISEYTHMKNI